MRRSALEALDFGTLSLIRRTAMPGIGEIVAGRRANSNKITGGRIVQKETPLFPQEGFGDVVRSDPVPGRLCRYRRY